jgi:hypothetical protein
MVTILCDSKSAVQAVAKPSSISGQHIVIQTPEVARTLQQKKLLFASSGSQDTVTTQDTRPQINLAEAATKPCISTISKDSLILLHIISVPVVRQVNFEAAAESLPDVYSINRSTSASASSL